MTVELTSDQVWEVIEKNKFGVLGMVTAKNEARTVGIIYILRDRRLYIGTWTDSWKVRHVAQKPHVSLTIPVHKSVPLMPWIKIPAATITFCGEADIIAALDAPHELLEELYHGVAEDQELVVHPKTCTIFSGFSVVLKDGPYSNCSLSTSLSQRSSHLPGGWLPSAECRRASL